MNKEMIPLEWIKDNCRILLDECISIKLNNRLEKYMKDKGYKYVYNVYDMKLRGNNDGQILRYIIDNKFVLITFDKHFNKMAKRYNKNMCFKLKQYDGHMSAKSTSNKIQCLLIHDFKAIKSFIENNGFI